MMVAKVKYNSCHNMKILRSIHQTYNKARLSKSLEPNEVTVFWREWENLKFPPLIKTSFKLIFLVPQRMGKKLENGIY